MSVDVDVAGPGPCIEPRDGFLDLKSFSELCLRFISLMHVDDKVKEKISRLHKFGTPKRAKKVGRNRTTCRFTLKPVGHLSYNTRIPLD